MQTGYRLPLSLPLPEQPTKLFRMMGCQRRIYNCKVREDRAYRKAIKENPDLPKVEPNQQYAHFITEETSWLREVHSEVLRLGATNWRDAKQRYLKHVAKQPKLHGKNAKRSVHLTKALFKFVPVENRQKGQPQYRLFLGTPHFPIGEVFYRADRDHAIPKSIHISIDEGQFFVSFSIDDKIPEPLPEEVAEELAKYTREDLEAVTIGVDRGVAIPFACSNGKNYEFSKDQKERFKKKEKKRARYQRQMARRTPGGANYKKAQGGAAKCARYGKNARRDFAHKTSHDMVVDEKIKLIVFEGLNIKGMTKRAKPKQDANGKWQRNGATAKTAGNKSKLESAWGMTKTYASYKALRAGKLVIVVPPPYTSQTCRICGHNHKDNRKSQADFVCLRCGHAENADYNASCNIKALGIKEILDGKHSKPKKKKSVVVRRKKKTIRRDAPEFTPGRDVNPLEGVSNPPSGVFSDTKVRRKVVCSTDVIARSLNQEGNPHLNLQG
jgi:putative transposase